MKGSIFKEISKDVIYYIPAQLIPGICGFIAIGIYTRFLSPGDYGIYILIINTISLLISIGLGWVYNSVLRYYELYKKDHQLSQFISTTSISLFLIPIILAILILMIFILFFKFSIKFLVLAFIAIFTFIGKSFYSYVISILRAKRQTLRYSIYSSLNSFGNIILPILFFLCFYPSPEAILLGIALSSVIIVIIEIRNLYKYLSFSFVSYPVLKKCFSYGLPLVGVTFASMIISISDRYIIQLLKGSTDVGIYASGYDLVDKSIKIGFSVLLAASYPIIVQQYEQKGGEEIKKILGRLLNIYILIFAPIVLIFITMAPQIVKIFLGKAFRNASVIVPWIALGTFFLGLSQILAQWLQLKEKTRIIFFIFLISAIINVDLNFVLIPNYGILGAAIATFISYLVCLIFYFRAFCKI